MIRMSNVVKLLLSLSLGFFMFASCKKDRIVDKPLNEYKSVNDYFNSKKQQEQEFTIDSAGKAPIIGNQGTKIWPSKDRLMFANGDSVHWPYTVKLIELYSAKDMLYYQMPNVGGGNILTTCGEIRLRAYKDGQELVLRPSKTWSILMPSKNPLTDMKQFYGLDATSFTDWVANPAGDFVKTDTGYYADDQKLGWISCDKDASSASSVTVSFISFTDVLTNVGIFIYIPSKQSLIQVYNQISGKIPVGSDIKIIAIGINANDETYYYYKEMTLGQSDEKLDISLQSISKNDLEVKLDALK